MDKRVSGFLAMLVGVCLLAGCQSMYVVPTAQKTPSQCGNIRLYGTDNVPFEYEELGAIGYYSQYEPQDEGLQRFVSEAQKMGADAILNFRVQPENASGGFVLVLTVPNKVVFTGTAVKIKRP